MSRLACHDLSVSVADIQVVKSLDLEIKAGELWGLLGPNGIGKTTLLKCLAGLIPGDSGEIFIDSTPLGNFARRALAQRLGMLQQHTVYMFDSNVLQIVLTGRHPHLRRYEHESRQDIEAAQAALEEVGLRGFEDRGVTSLSGGEARRLAFAALLVQDPEIMLLDEPTNHLDLRHQLQVMRIARGHVEGGNCTALAALHDINLAARYCSHILMLPGDGAWRAGPCREMLQRESLEALYGCALEMVETAAGPRFHPLADASVSES